MSATSHRDRNRSPFSGVCLAATLVGCGTPSTPIDPVDASAPVDVGLDGGPLSATDQLDLLLMIDDSSGMQEAQLRLQAAIPRLVSGLLTGDRDGDGIADFAPVRSLHVGVVTSDVGIGSTLGMCDERGNDGLLRSDLVVTSSPACDAYDPTRYPHGIFAFQAGDDAAALSADVACMVTGVGTSGCSFEQGLESVLHALTPAPAADGTSSVPWTRDGYHPPTFRGGSPGRGADAATNGGFLRPDSALAILMLGDEDDCASTTDDLFSPTGPYAAADLGVRCVVYPDVLQPLTRYVDGFASLRRDPRRVAFAVVAGVPLALSGHAPAEILADPAMTIRPDPTTHMLARVCEGDLVAYPAIRMTGVARGLEETGASVTVHSACANDYESAAHAIVAAIVPTLGG